MNFKFTYKVNKDDDMEDPHGNKVHRRVQSIDSEQKPGTINPPDGFVQETFGWVIETDPIEKVGTCLTKPNAMSSPFPQLNLRTCISDLEFACFKINESMCPCYDDRTIANTEAMLKKQSYDPNFVLDMNKSCKDPSANNGLPYGLYTKPTQDHSDDYADFARYPGLRFGVQKNMGTHDVNECYDGTDIAYPELNSIQHSDCINLVQSVCDRLNISPTQNSHCQDEPDYKHMDKAWKTCEKLTSTKWKQRKNCKKYDDMETKKLVLQKCRKSCQSCTCVDRSDFYYNGQEDYNCTSLQNLARGEKKQFCSDEDVAINCPVTCNTKCCMDDPKFKFKVRRYKIKKDDDRHQRNLHRWKVMRCKDIGQSEWRDICKRRRIAARCPMTCRKCLIQPRGGQ